MKNEKSIQSFLKFGYFMDYANKDYEIDFSNIDKALYKNYDEVELIEIGINKFLSTINDEFDINQKHVVPLSGGIDSRAILAALLEYTDATNIYTYTFGTPGTLDYDIGCNIAKIIGTSHTSLPLTEYSYSMDELLDISKRVNYQTYLFHHPPVWECDKLFQNHIVWSGYIGDAIVGGHLPKYPSLSDKDAKSKYIDNKGYVNSVNLHKCNKYDFMRMMDFICIDKHLMTYDEQLLYRERCDKLTAPHVLLKGYCYKTPFINNPWMDFMLSIDDKYRHKQYLYRKILLNKFPKLFSYNTKTNFGLPVNAGSAKVIIKRTKDKIKRDINNIISLFTNENINYIDFNEGIRERKDLREIVYMNIMDLKKRNIVDWVDIDAIWASHINKEANHADALIVLTSLEIHFKAKEL